MLYAKCKTPEQVAEKFSDHTKKLALKALEASADKITAANLSPDERNQLVEDFFQQIREHALTQLQNLRSKKG